MFFKVFILIFHGFFLCFYSFDFFKVYIDVFYSIFFSMVFIEFSGGSMVLSD